MTQLHTKEELRELQEMDLYSKIAMTEERVATAWKEFVCDTGWFKSTTYICRGIPGVDA